MTRDYSGVSFQADLSQALSKVLHYLEEDGGYKLILDLGALKDVQYRVEKTLKGYGLERGPNPFKAAGHLVFWIRRLKPISCKANFLQ